MSFLVKCRKSNLIELGTEPGVTIPPEAVIANIKRLITSSENYDEEFVKQVFERIIEERIKREENERMENENAMISHKLNEKENSRIYVDSHKVFNSSIRNEKGEPKCFSCNLFGHISKDCPNPCTLCGLKGH
ncbi:hypothetical protein CEXT_725261 [Caerostris extrusa]|uniref:CCHC-type domain-containing protein n=1 Tax=Caerostris extrusa TaxID=172846 RepID=A0AAV4NPB5_CAEEX|nr:hypothetical protein CEXT_725261 [Caerostris extrusa]